MLCPVTAAAAARKRKSGEIADTLDFALSDKLAAEAAVAIKIASSFCLCGWEMGRGEASIGWSEQRAAAMAGAGGAAGGGTRPDKAARFGSGGSEWRRDLTTLVHRAASE
ncbi:hypothetical protein AXG93_1527s1060 [Marchantia polymorpha subsp. ruderalis]|uniref:Uncharacterized protein n=1 Tax=Marchantia polymorpha subsp. ruderalis TaxID=1480154 RepID=A0A176W9L6_MARPO|nr:hypothetical protein AXG93_1527s1060 [Marchantia polymorpha subsp. ruderalis]